MPESLNTSVLIQDIIGCMSMREIALLEKSRCEVKYNAGEVIIKIGTKVSQVMFLSSGLAKSYIEGFSDKNLIIRIIKPNEVIGVLPSYVGDHHQYSVMAIEDSICVFYDLEVYKEIARKNSKVYDKLTQNICNYAMLYYTKFISLSLKQVNGRIAETLLYLHNEIYNVNPIELSISKHDIAEMTGMSKDTATRVLKSFHEEGIIVKDGNSITIVDADKLEQISLNG